jgi:hypothetical protein
MWRSRINIKPHLHHPRNAKLQDHDVPLPETIDGIVAELRKTGIPQDAIEALQAAKTVLQFNVALNRIYDLADERRVWMGL